MTLRHSKTPVRWLPWLSVLVPTLLVLAWTLLMRTEPASLAAPFLGPWAGFAYGHESCTMATRMPGWSAAVAAVGVLLLPVAWPLSRRLPWIAAGLLLAWALAWNGLALLSVANTLS